MLQNQITNQPISDNRMPQNPNTVAPLPKLIPKKRLIAVFSIVILLLVIISIVLYWPREIKPLDAALFKEIKKDVNSFADDASFFVEEDKVFEEVDKAYEQDQ